MKRNNSKPQFTEDKIQNMYEAACRSLEFANQQKEKAIKLLERAKLRIDEIEKQDSAEKEKAALSDDAICSICPLARTCKYVNTWTAIKERFCDQYKFSLSANEHKELISKIKINGKPQIEQFLIRPLLQSQYN